MRFKWERNALPACSPSLLSEETPAAALYLMCIRKCRDKSRLIVFHPLHKTGLAILHVLGSDCVQPEL